LEEEMNLTVQSGEKWDSLMVAIGSQIEFKATLPLNPAEDFLATDQQRARIGWAALDRIIEEDPANSKLGWRRYGLLLDEIMKRTGINDAAASLVLFARRDELEEKENP
jgi:hypothetical protein